MKILTAGLRSWTILVHNYSNESPISASEAEVGWPSRVVSGPRSPCHTKALSGGGSWRHTITLKLT